MKKFFLLILILIMSMPLWARKPAVDPIMGISIDNEPKVKEPSLSTGFQFSSYQEIKRHPQSIEQNNEMRGQTQEPDKVTPFFFMFLLLFLPVGLWFGIMKNIKGPGEKEWKNQISDFSKKSDPENYKKAS